MHEWGADVKSFSPSGAATKAFYGLGARTFGNPDGNLSGNGAWARGGGGGGGGGTWVPGVVASPVAAIAIVNAFLYVALLQDGNAIRSINGGASWSGPIATPLSGGLGGEIATNGASVVAQGVTPGSVVLLIQSTDGGLTWFDVTPPGESPHNLQYLPIKNIYIAYGVAFVVSTNLFTSHSGTIWNTTTVFASVNPSGPFVEGAGLIVGPISDVNTNPMAAAVLRSDDAGAIFTIQGNATLDSLSAGQVAYDGVSWIMGGSSHNPGGESWNADSFDAGVWTIRNLSTGFLSPPWPQMFVFNARFLTYDSFQAPAPFAVSFNHGGTGGWVGHTVPIAGFQISELADVVGTLVLGSASGFGFSGVISTTDLVNYVTELTLTSGSIDFFSQGSGVLLGAGTDDAANNVIWKRS